MTNLDEKLTRNAESVEWKVYFHGNFWGHHGSEPAGEEHRLDVQFSWGERTWVVPAVYLCRSGLVLDLCARVEPELFRAFLEKWNLTLDADESLLTEEARERLSMENPLNLDINPVTICNGIKMKRKSASGTSWIPELPEGMKEDSAAQQVLAHYGLDPKMCWSLHRVCFPWPSEEPRQIHSLQLNMVQERIGIPGPHLTAQAGDQIGFTHPVTGVQHCLTVHALQREELEQARFGDDEREYPNHYVLMDYSVWPPLSPQALSVLDCEPSDALRYKTGSTDKGAAAIGSIGGFDGPTAIIVGSEEKQTHRAACSALRFAPQEQVHWRIVFHEKCLEDQMVVLL